MSHPLKYSPSAWVLPSGQQPYVELEQSSGISVVVGRTVVVSPSSSSFSLSSSFLHPSCLGPFASVVLSGQQPNLNYRSPTYYTQYFKEISYLDLAHSGGGGGHPSLSLPVAAVLLSGQQPKRVSSQSVGGQPSKCLPPAGETPSSQQPNLVSLQVLVMGQPYKNTINVNVAIIALLCYLYQMDLPQV